MQTCGIFVSYFTVKNIFDSTDFRTESRADPGVIYSRLVISKSKGLSEILRDIRTSHRFAELKKK